MPAPSLILEASAAAAAAPGFSFLAELETGETKLATAGEFTGERLHRDRPGIYAAVVRMAAEGQSISMTARALGVSRNTVCAVRDREGLSVEQDRKELLRDLRRAGRLSVEKVIELLPDLKSAKDAAITAAVMVDKMQLLAGEATARVERLEVRPDQVRTFLDSLPVIEVDAEIIGGPGETSWQKAAGSGAAVAELLPSVADCQSGVPSITDSVAEGGRTSFQTSLQDGAGGEGEPAGWVADGGGGGGPSDTHAPGGIDCEIQNFGQRQVSGPIQLAADDDNTNGGVSEDVAGRPEIGGGVLGRSPAPKDLCTPKKKMGGSTAQSPSSKRVRNTKKKKGGSE